MGAIAWCSRPPIWRKLKNSRLNTMANVLRTRLTAQNAMIRELMLHFKKKIKNIIQL
jgi:hypothetical protein